MLPLYTQVVPLSNIQKNREDTLTMEWVTGFIEGEGCFSIFTHKDRKKGYEKPQCKIVISQKERYILEQINKFLGEWGYIRLHRNKTGGCYSLQLSKHTKLREVAPIIGRMLKSLKKRQQFDVWYKILLETPIGVGISERRWKESEMEVIKQNIEMTNEQIRAALINLGYPERTLIAIQSKRWKALTLLGMTRPHKHTRSLCPKCGEYGILRFDLAGYPVVRHYKITKEGYTKIDRSHWITSISLLVDTPQLLVPSMYIKGVLPEITPPQPSGQYKYKQYTIKDIINHKGINSYTKRQLYNAMNQNKSLLIK
jgi:hypothetical protein